MQLLHYTPLLLLSLLLFFFIVDAKPFNWDLYRFGNGIWERWWVFCTCLFITFSKIPLNFENVFMQILLKQFENCNCILKDSFLMLCFVTLYVTVFFCTALHHIIQYYIEFYYGVMAYITSLSINNIVSYCTILKYFVVYYIKQH